MSTNLHTTCTLSWLAFNVTEYDSLVHKKKENRQLCKSSLFSRYWKTWVLSEYSGKNVREMWEKCEIVVGKLEFQRGRERERNLLIFTGSAAPLIPCLNTNRKEWRRYSKWGSFLLCRPCSADCVVRSLCCHSAVTLLLCHSTLVPSPEKKSTINLIYLNLACRLLLECFLVAIGKIHKTFQWVLIKAVVFLVILELIPLR